ncbi:MAG: hypothetical protein WC348_04105 [Patescibacteria group bacterium]|jgi:hypothetical protein
MTLSVFLIAYYIFLGLFILFSLFAVYHMVRFVPLSSIGFFTTYIFLAGAAIIIFATWQEIQLIDWTQSFFTLNFSL